MLDLDRVDLSALGDALEDHSDVEGSWWIDPRTGAIECWYPPSISGIDEDEQPSERGCHRIEALSSGDS